MRNKKLKLAPFVLKRYEPQVGYCFYNAKTKSCINADYTSGVIVEALDGSFSVEEVINILLENNKEVSTEVFTEKFISILERLHKEEFLVEIA